LVFSGFLVLIIFIFVLIMLGGGLAMTKNISLRSLYLYLVCLVTLIIFIFGTIFTAQRVVDIFFEGRYYYISIEDYEQRFNTYGPKGEVQAPNISKDEIKTRYETYLMEEKKRERNNSIRQLASSFSAMVVGGIFWYYHWKKIGDQQE
jgi:hypothetical protein